MAKLDFIPVTGYSLYVCCQIEGERSLLTTPIIGLYIERHAWAVEALTATGQVEELNSCCVLKCPDGKFVRANKVFKDETAWLEDIDNFDQEAYQEAYKRVAAAGTYYRWSAIVAEEGLPAARALLAEFGAGELTELSEEALVEFNQCLIERGY